MDYDNLETSELIPRVIHDMMKDIPYCGSCMCGCNEMTRFICLGMSSENINKYLDSKKSDNNSDKKSPIEI